MTRTLADVEQDVKDWITRSGPLVARRYLDAAGRAWLLKFFPPQYLAGFMRVGRMVVSNTPGFTWGDGVYAVPLDHVYSAMIYGRVGVMGWVAAADLARVYDASDATGLGLYQEWIRFKPGLFTMLTTTVHAPFANRQLRNAFRARFRIDLVTFRPDEYNRAYVQPSRDRWCAVSDFAAGAALPSGTVGYSAKVRECELVAIGAEEFAIGQSGFTRHDLIGPTVSPPSLRRGAARPSLAAVLTSMYQTNRARGGAPPSYVRVNP